MAKPKSKSEEPEAVEPDAPKTVKMTREGDAPNTADVHPDEVANYQAAGWRIAQ